MKGKDDSMAICKWCGEKNADGVNVCAFCGQDMSIFEDSGILKNAEAPAAEQSRSRIPMTSGSINVGAVNAGATRSAARAQQIQQAQRKGEYVTRNQLKQVAYRLDQRSRLLTVLTALLGIVAVAAVALGVLSFMRSNAKPDTSATDSTIAQLQSQVSTLELELQSVNAKLDQMQENPIVQPDTEPNTGNTQPNTGDTQPDTKPDISTTDPDQPGTPDTPSQDTDVNNTPTTDLDTEIETTFEKVEGDETSIYAKVNQTFSGTTTYQWQKSTNLETWNDVNTSAAKTDTLKISIDDYLRNNAYRCRITNVDSKGVTVIGYTEIVDYNAYQIWSLIG